MGKRYLLLVVLVVLIVIAFSRAWTRPIGVESVTKHTPQSRSSIPTVPSAVLSNNITFFGGTTWAADSMRWEAVKDSVWTFDSGVGSAIIQPGNTYPGVDPFKPVGFHAYMEGWVGVDLTLGTEHGSFFRRLSALDPRWGASVCVGSPAGLGGNYSFWAGAFQSEADSLCYVSGQGYGNAWVLCIGREFTYTSGGVTLSFDTVVETESGYDFATVEVDTSGAGDIVEAVAYDGSVVGTQNLSLTPGLELPLVGNVNIQIRFCFGSDGAWSDQDGLNPTNCGAFAVDNISISGGGISHSTDFEADDGGWSLLPQEPSVGDFSRLMSVGDLPPISDPMENCTLADSVLVFFDPSSNGHPSTQNNVALSPWIDLERAGLVGMPGKSVHYQGSFDFSPTNVIVVTAVAQWFPDTCQATGAIGVSDLVYGPRFIFESVCPLPVDFSSLIPVDAKQIRIGIGVVNFCSFYFGCPSPAETRPWFDNLRFGVSPFLNLQDLIDSASPGDTILVPAGTYTGPGNKDLDFGGKNLVFWAPSGPDSTVIDCQGLGRGFIFQSGEDSTSVVDGFTIKRGDVSAENGGGILVTGGSRPTIQNCVITMSNAASGGGIYVASDSGARVILCSITNNTAGAEGGGIRGWGNTFIDQCTITDNTAGSYGGGVSQIGGSIIESYVLRNQAQSGGGIYGGLISNCVVSDNSATFSGGGISLAAIVEGCFISGNTASSGGGVNLDVASMTDCVISDNVASYAGGGVFLGRSTMERCTITGNSAPSGGGIFAVPANFVGFPVGGDVTTIDCIITGNEADQGGGINVQFDQKLFNLTGSTVSGNHALEGGGIYNLTPPSGLFPRNSIVISTNSIVWGNCINGPGGDEIVLADTLSSIQFTCSAVNPQGIKGPGTALYLGPQVFSDPKFCDPRNCQTAPTIAGDYGLLASSPCLPASSPCGSLIGALGQGCSATGLPDDRNRERPLLAVFPNPFSAFLNMEFSVPVGTSPTVRIFDVAGHMVHELNLETKSGTAIWDGTDHSKRKVGLGVYFIQLRAGSNSTTVRVVRVP